MFPNKLRLAAAIGAVFLVPVVAFAMWQGQLAGLVPAASPSPSSSPAAQLPRTTELTDLQPGHWTTGDVRGVEISFVLQPDANAEGDRWEVRLAHSLLLVQGRPNRSPATSYVRVTTEVFDHFYADPCLRQGEVPLGSLDETARYLADHPNASFEGTPTDVVVSGHRAKLFNRLTIDCEGFDESPDRWPWFWVSPNNDLAGFNGAESLWLIDVDGATVALTTTENLRYGGPVRTNFLAARDGLLESLQFVRRESLTTSPMAGPAPAGTPGPGAIAYLRGGQIMLLDPATGDERALTPQLSDVVAEHVGSDCVGEAPDLPVAPVGPSSMAWSPDGRALAFVVVHSCGHTVFGISADGTTMRVLLNAERFGTRSTRGGHVYGLHWSPDGSRITVSGASELTANGEQTIIVVSLDASEPIELGTICEKCSLYSEVSGAWSPDGTMVAAIFYHPEETDALVAVVDVMAGRWTTLWSGQSGERIFVPAVNPWLPDGSLIIEAGGELFAVHPDNPQQRTALVVETLGGIGWDLMSPDGSRMVSSDLDGHLVVSDIGTGETAQLADLKGSTYALAWSPDSSEIAVVVSESIPGPSSVWVVSADGSNAREVLETGSESQLVWQPVWP